MPGVSKLFRVFVGHKKKTVLIVLALLVGGSMFSAVTNWGIRGKYYANREWKEDPLLVRRDKRVFLRDAKSIPVMPNEAFSVKWQGWIAITEPGTYRFSTNSDDGSYLSIDNTPVVDNGGAHGLQKVDGEIFLEQGTYRLEILYFNAGGGWFMSALWMPPDNAEERLPTDVLFVKRPTAIGILFRKGVTTWAPQLRMILLIVGILLLFLVPLAVFFKLAKPSSKTLVFSGILLLFVLVAIEVFSWLFFTLVQNHFTFFSPRQYLVTPEQQEQMLKGQLSQDEFFTFGWNTNFDTPYGERPRKTEYNKPVMSAFGDSFTYCAEVEHDETWQTYLADLLEVDVYNFGVGGYGTDQAYLKYLSVYPDIVTPIVFLGLTTENINRIVNVYRPFYFPRTAGRVTKPRFVLKDGELALLENPVRNREDVKKLGDLQFIQRLGEHDWWYNRDNYPILQFPYTKILFNKRMWLEIFYGRKNRKISDIDPRPWSDLWETEEATSLMFRIFDGFVEDAKKRGAIPIIIVLPLQHQVQVKFQTKQHESQVNTLLDYCASKNYTCFETITPLANSVTDENEIQSLYHGHVSAKGNRVIAEALSRFLQQTFPDVIRQYQ